MDRDVAVLLRRRHDVVMRMLTNVIWDQSGHNLGTLRSCRVYTAKKQIGSGSNPRMLMGAKDFQIDPTSMYM
jgi:hypothetical protein